MGPYKGSEQVRSDRKKVTLDALYNTLFTMSHIKILVTLLIYIFEGNERIIINEGKKNQKSRNDRNREEQKRGGKNRK